MKGRGFSDATARHRGSVPDTQGGIPDEFNRILQAGLQGCTAGKPDAVGGKVDRRALRIRWDR